jgi:hypothetical protein
MDDSMFSKTPEISDFVCVLRGYYTILSRKSLVIFENSFSIEKNMGKGFPYPGIKLEKQAQNKTGASF